MSGLLAIVTSVRSDDETRERLIETIDLSHTRARAVAARGRCHLAVTSLANAPLKGTRLHENDRWIVLWGGDIVEHESPPFEEIITALERGSGAYFEGLDGIFCVTAYDMIEEKLYAVSDRRSQHPLFYGAGAESFCISTDLATFCRLNGDPQFNEAWLWEYLFFNYPVGESTFLRGVRRISPASILEYDLDSNRYAVHRYAGTFRKSDHLLDGAEAVAFAAEVFSRRTPKYYEGATDIACALTGGWDGRTMLALAPSDIVTAYTYGIPGCHDLEGAGKTAHLADIRHIKILFDEAFTRDLPQYMLETVFLSSGLQGVLRATLLYAYRELTEGGRRFPLTISGLSMDMQFRGHACAPALISHDIVPLFETGRAVMRKAYWSSLLKGDYESFNDHISRALQSLEKDFGPFDDTTHHLSYILYVLSPQYFCGEIKTADHFTTVRVPCWDREIIDLSYSITQSTLSFSQFSPHTRGDISELVLQSYLLYTLGGPLGRTPIGNTRPDIVLRGKTVFQLYRIARGTAGRIAGLFGRSRKYPPLEDWSRWLNEYCREFIDGLIFSSDSRIRRFVREEFLERLKNNRDTHLIGKLATAEIILRLIEERWKRYW